MLYQMSYSKLRVGSARLNTRKMFARPSVEATRSVSFVGKCRPSASLRLVGALGIEPSDLRVGLRRRGARKGCTIECGGREALSSQGQLCRLVRVWARRDGACESDWFRKRRRPPESDRRRPSRRIPRATRDQVLSSLIIARHILGISIERSRSNFDLSRKMAESNRNPMKDPSV